MIEIKHFYTGNVLFSHDTDSIKACVEAAVKAEVNLWGADLRYAYLRGADLVGADLTDTNLWGANLGGAYLTGANLTGANLWGADLGGAYLVGVAEVIPAGQPNGYWFYGWHKDGVLMIRGGCHNFTIHEAREYWTGKEERREVLAALDYIEAVAKIREWGTDETL